MRQDWIEFKVDNGKLFVKYYDLESVSNTFSKIAGSCSSISLSNGTSHTVYEPYEQVKQKIMDAEKVDLSDVVVEHFTREEYEYLLRLCKNATQPNDGYTPDWPKLNPIMNKLNEIIKEDK